MAALTFLDTNVIGYAYDPHQGRKHARALDILDSIGSAVISTQVVLELYSVLTQKMRLEPEAAERAVEHVLGLQVVPTDAPLVRHGIALGIAHGISHWDAMIVAAAQRAGCDEIMTEDLNHGQSIDGLRIVNPFLHADE